MDRLATCYFCGTAADAELGEYPVVPRSLDPVEDHQATVTLCPQCRQKLAGIVDRILETVESAPGAASTRDAAGSSDTSGADAPAATPPTSDTAGTTDPGEAAADDADAAAAGQSDDGGGSSTIDVEDLPVSAQEFNKVMRLLGNREFPVERSSFVMVASNAYGVSTGQVDAVLDVAVERGAIAVDEEDQLVRPE